MQVLANRGSPRSCHRSRRPPSPARGGHAEPRRSPQSSVAAASPPCRPHPAPRAHDQQNHAPSRRWEGGVVDQRATVAGVFWFFPCRPLLASWSRIPLHSGPPSSGLGVQGLTAGLLTPATLLPALNPASCIRFRGWPRPAGADHHRIGVAAQDPPWILRNRRALGSTAHRQAWWSSRRTRA